MDKSTEKRSEFDQGQSPLESEKRLENGAPVAVPNLADPDEGLSEEERRKIVRPSFMCARSTLINPSAGSQAAVEA